MAINVEAFPGREILVDGIPHLYFGGTAYLGLQTFPKFQQLYIENVKRYGTNYGASRMSNIRLSVFEEAESYLAKLVGSESCITLSSGYLAGQFILRFLQGKKHKFFYAPNSHSALQAKKPKNYVTYASLSFALNSHLTANDSITPVIFLDSIDFSGGNYPDFNGLKSLPLHKCIVVVDDSHGIGIVGKNGEGVFKSIEKLNPRGLYVCCSLGKGFGIQAGAIFGTETNIDKMKETPFFGGASPAAPSAMATLLDATSIYGNRRKLLKTNIVYFLDRLAQLEKFRFMPEHSAFTFKNPKLVALLKKHHIIITDFNYPNEHTDMMSRIVISASHTKTDIEKLVFILNSSDYK